MATLKIMGGVKPNMAKPLTTIISRLNFALAKAHVGVSIVQSLNNDGDEKISENLKQVNDAIGSACNEMVALSKALREIQ